jgi:hypothetical protein
VSLVPCPWEESNTLINDPGAGHTYTNAHTRSQGVGQSIHHTLFYLTPTTDVVVAIDLHRTLLSVCTIAVAQEGRPGNVSSVRLHIHAAYTHCIYSHAHTLLSETEGIKLPLLRRHHHLHRGFIIVLGYEGEWGFGQRTTVCDCACGCVCLFV